MNSRNRNRNRTGTGTGHPTHNTETSLSFAPSAPRRPRNPYTDPDAPEYYELPSRHISVAEARKISEARRLQLQERMGGPPTGPGISSSGFGLSGHYGAF
ncbi:MAG: hypothetical protein MMC33_009829 [Icmadophila ericetorum]|nr:hypothetical protein [Icmadophila ericetorum]